jgi:ferric-dicitrate binding protein FerR (iron transport regulator)
LDRELEAWIARTPLAPPARAAFRAELRGGFVGGRLHAPLAERPAGGRWLRRAALAAAAAGILAVTFLLPDPPRWEIELAGPVRVAGEEFRPGEENRIEVELEVGAELESLGSPVWLRDGAGLELELRPGSRLLVPALPEPGPIPIELALERGELLLRTDPDLARSPLRVATPLAEVVPVGTVFGVLVDGEGACVCVARGRVEVTSVFLPGGAAPVEEGWSLRFRGEPGTAPLEQPFPDDPAAPDFAHVAELRGFAAD